MPRHFICKKEDFTCEICRTQTKGNGYTNHCPNCFWSKHVDKEVPGDRSSPCQGLMEPIGVETKAGKYLLIHQCQKCRKVSKNKSEDNDNFEKIIEITRSFNKLLLDKLGDKS